MSVSTNLSAAYNLIDHKIFLCKLAELGSNANELMKCCLYNQKNTTAIQGYFKKNQFKDHVRNMF